MKILRRLSLSALAILLSTLNIYADNYVTKEKVVTSKWSYISGDAIIANHYLSDQEYSGSVLGLGMKFGSLYKSSEKISWDIDIAYILSPYSSLLDDFCIANPSRTSFYTLHSLDADYGTYYNWNPAKNLYIKAGGSFDLLTGLTLGKPNHINNIMDLDFQTQLKAAAGIRYGYNFKKFGLFVQADVAVPFIGMALASSKYTSSMDSILGAGIFPGKSSPICFTSLHNMTGFNTEFEIDLVFKKSTLFFSIEGNKRWWNLKGIQNYRKYTLSRLGFKVDLVARSRHNSDNMYF